MKKTTLLVMAAGMGSRFGGLKQIEPVGPNGEILLDYSAYDARAAGFDKIVFIIKKDFEKSFREAAGRRIEKMLDVDYAFQEISMIPKGFTLPANREKPWGTGHAVLCAAKEVNTPFAVINADDYYGGQSFNIIHEHLVGDSIDFAMVGFLLKNTLTENGTVSRGVCEIENGYLKSVEEILKIKDCAYTLNDTDWIKLPEDTTVSMNMWGFDTSAFAYLENGFISFLEENISAAKSEYYLPSMISALIQSGEKRIKVLKTDEKWYGVTYKEDKEAVRRAMSARTL